jgi:hypothetical protein
MGKFLLSLLLLASLFTSSTSNSSPSPKIEKNAIYSDLDDGWYIAKIKYQNFSTGTISNYRLKVKVQYNRVIRIDFGNGGSVHTGVNSDGYLYTGGQLSRETDYRGNIIAYTTKVTITDRNGMRTFAISIE